jgi:hypothetical protein
MRFVVGVVKDKLLQFCELALDSVQPRGIGGCPDECDQVFSRPTSYLFAFMGGEVVQNQKDPLVLGVSCTHPLEHFQCLLPSFSAPEITPEHVLVNVIESQELSDTVRAVVCGRQTVWFSLPCPS